MKQPRILFVTDVSSMGGAEAVLLEIIKAARSIGIECALFIAFPGSNVAEWRKALPPGVAVSYPEPTWTTGLEARLFPRAWRLVKQLDEYSSERLAALPNVAAALWRTARAFRADLVYIAKLLPHVASLVRALGLPYALHSHATPPSLRGFRAGEVRKAIGEANSLLAGSQNAAEFLRALGAADPFLLYDGGDVVPLGAEETSSRAEFRSKLGADESDFLWYMAGRFEYEKGCDFIEPLMKSLEGTRARFVWIGTTPDCAFAAYCAARLKANPRVHILGRQDEYRKWLAAFDGMAFVSREDCFPLVAIEAAAMGRPIVTFASGGVVELLAETAVPVIADWSLTAVAGAMRRIMDDPVALQQATAVDRGNQFGFERLRSEWIRYWRAA